MAKENVVYVYNRIIFRIEKKANPAICNNTNEIRGPVKRNKPVTEEKYCMILSFI